MTHIQEIGNNSYPITIILKKAVNPNSFFSVVIVIDRDQPRAFTPASMRLRVSSLPSSSRISPM